jgi:hypothetical protein
MPTWFGNILENILVMVLTIIVFVGGIYLLLLILHAWLRFKSGSREAEGLTNLWQESQAQSRSRTKEDDSAQPP